MLRYLQMESSDYFQGSLDTYWHPAIHLPLCQSHWAGCTCQRPAPLQLLHSSAWCAGTSLNLSQFKVAWAAKSGAEVWICGPFCQLCYVWQEAPQEEHQDIEWQQQSPKQSEFTWRILKTSVSAHLDVSWESYRNTLFGFFYPILLSSLSMVFIFLCQHVCIHFCFLRAYERKRAERKHQDVLVLYKA